MFVESLKTYTDIRGDLCPLSFSEVPFSPKRMFIVSNVPKGVERGGHAHYETEQYLVCLSGEIEVQLYNGISTTSSLLKPMQGVFVPKLTWDSQIFKSDNALLLVLASTEYSEKDYINSMSLLKEILR